MIRNLTAHTVRLFGVVYSEELNQWVEVDWATVDLPPCEDPPRVSMARERVLCVPTTPGDEPVMVPVNRTVTGEVEGLPEQTLDWLVVSRQVAEARPDRGDLLIVDETVRDEQGRIIGARALASLATPEAFQAFVERRERELVSPEAAL